MYNKSKESKVNDMDRLIQKHTAKLQKQENRYLNKKPNPALDATASKLQEIIPQGLQSKMQAAFYQGFKLVFSKGTIIIEKTFDKEKLAKIHETENFAFNRDLKKRALKHMDSSVSTGNLATLGLTVTEGAALGLLGIGLPDIPVFIGVLLKGIYEIALKYGYSYDGESERYYILILIEAALSKDTERLNKLADDISNQIDTNCLPRIDLDAQMRKTADAMAADMLSMKFIQGMPLIGIIGGVSNAIYFSKVTKYARIKYKKRYLCTKK